MRAGNWKKEIAEAIAKEAYVGFVPTGGYFAVDTDGDDEANGVYWRDRTAQFNPWPKDAEAVSVMAFCDEWNDYSDEDDDTEPEDMISFIMDTMREESQEL